MTQDTSTKYVKNTNIKKNVFLSMLENRNVKTKICDFRHIELNVFLGKLGVAGTGGQAKSMIRSGEVKVNGEIETRNKRKLHAQDIVEYSGKKYAVEEKLLR